MDNYQHKNQGLGKCWKTLTFPLSPVVRLASRIATKRSELINISLESPLLYDTCHNHFRHSATNLSKCGLNITNSQSAAKNGRCQSKEFNSLSLLSTLYIIIPFLLCLDLSIHYRQDPCSCLAFTTIKQFALFTKCQQTYRSFVSRQYFDLNTVYFDHKDQQSRSYFIRVKFRPTHRQSRDYVFIPWLL